jgi:LysR family nitrogen assimilation transcriptional regulator
MDLRELRYFIAVAEAGSFSAAAERHYVAQSALSRHVKSLEAQLGGELFSRGARGVELTESGELLFRRAKRLVDDVALLQQDVLAHHGELRGTASIVVPSSMSDALYPALVDHFSEHFPKVQLQLSEGLTREAIDRILHGEVEAAVVTDPPPNDHLEYEFLVEEQMWLVGPKGASRRTRSVMLGEALKLPLITPTRTNWPKQLEATMTSTDGAPPVVQVDSIVQMLRIVEDGHGCAIVPSFSLGMEVIKRLPVTAVSDYRVKRWIATSRGRPVSRASQELIAVVRRYAESFQATPPGRKPRKNR